MSDSTAGPGTRSHHRPTTGNGGAPEVRLRADADGCRCLACRPLDAIALRRTLLDAARWSVELCRSYPSILLLAGSFVLARRLLESVGVVPGPVAEFLEGLSALALFGFVRAYVGIVAAEALTGEAVSIGTRVQCALGRIPALLGLLVGFVGFFLVGSSVLTIPLFAVLVLVPGNPVNPTTFPVFAAAFALVTLVPVLFVVFKGWLAVEACVVGRYGPIQALRVSWGLTSTVRWRLAVTVLPLLAVGGLFYAVGDVPGSDLISGTRNPIVGAVTRSVGELTSVVWYGVYAHLYVQGVAEA
jgi:hypothetical protein